MTHLLAIAALLSAATAETRFLQAITKDDVAAVRSLLKEDPGLAARAKTGRGNSALVVAALLMVSEEYFYPPAKNEVLREVMRHAPPASAFEACLVGDLGKARSFIDKDAAALKEEKIGWTLLHAAAFSGNVELVKYLVSKKLVVDAEAQTKYKNTPLQAAMMAGQGDAARALVAAGADVNHPQWEGFTVLHDAAARGDMELIKFFLVHGANLKARNIRGDSAVSIAKSHNHPEVAAALEAL